MDPTSADGRLLLTSFVWPFDVARHQRLAGALQVAGRHPVSVDRAGAAAWLARQLAEHVSETLPVVWHSISQLYWSDAEIADVDAIMANYGARHPLAQVTMEFGRGRQPELRTTVWRRGGESRHRRLGITDDHGPPVHLHAD